MSYAPIIAPADLDIVLYPEIQDEITRSDTQKSVEAIDTAIQEVKTYITRFDTVQMFGDAGLDYAAVFRDSYLTRLVKNIAMWHLIQLCQVNINYDQAEKIYDKAIYALREIRDGKTDPKWPYLDTTGADLPEGDDVIIIANPKRDNY